MKPKDKPYSQIDYLVFNEYDTFNKIYSFLSEIEFLSNRVYPTIKKLQMALRSTDVNVDFTFHRELRTLNSNFIDSYNNAISLILFDLLAYIHYNIRSRKDSHILCSKIFDLLIGLNLQTSSRDILNKLI